MVDTACESITICKFRFIADDDATLRSKWKYAGHQKMVQRQSIYIYCWMRRQCECVINVHVFGRH